MNLIPLKNKVHGLSFYGPRGCGKTLGMTLLAYRGYTENNADIYANYELKFPYTKVKDTSFHRQIEADGRPKIICLDDIATGGGGVKSTYHEEELIKVLTLARKLIGEYSIICVSTPLKMMYSNIVVGYTDYLVRPYVWANADENPNLPVYMRLDFHSKLGDSDKFNYEATSKYYYCKGITDLFDTKEEPDIIVSGIYKEVWDKYNSYAYSKKRGVYSFLAGRIGDEFGLSNNEASRLAKRVLWGDNPYKESERKNNLKEWLSE